MWGERGCGIATNPPVPRLQDRKIVSAIFKHLVHNNVKEFGSDFIAKKNITIVDELVDL